MLAGRIETHGTATASLGAPLWGLSTGRRLDAVCLAGANLIPFARPGEERAAASAFAERARRAGRRCSTIVGPAASVLPLWELLAPAWGPAREVRARQPLLAIEGAAGGAGRAAGAAGAARRAGHAAARRDRDVHRGGRGQPDAGRRRRRLPRPGWRTWCGPASRWPGSRTARCCSRPTSGRSPGPRASSRASGWPRSSAGRASASGAPPPWSSTPAPRSRRSSASTSTTSTPPPGPPTSASASAGRHLRLGALLTRPRPARHRGSPAGVCQGGGRAQQNGDQSARGHPPGGDGRGSRGARARAAAGRLLVGPVRRRAAGRPGVPRRLDRRQDRRRGRG